MNNAPDPPPSSGSEELPPFTFVEDAIFESELQAVEPDRDGREIVCMVIEWTISRVLTNGSAPTAAVAALSEPPGSRLLLTERCAKAPPLRVVFVVVDEYPNRLVYLLGVSLRDQNGTG